MIGVLDKFKTVRTISELSKTPATLVYTFLLNFGKSVLKMKIFVEKRPLKCKICMNHT
jgi:hypothetical protein